MSDHPKILLVDDDSEILDLQTEFLSKKGFDVIPVSTLFDFQKKIQESNVDLIILDIMLPDGSGLETCKQLRNGGNKTPIILLTAVAETFDRVLGLEFGADDYISKPFNPHELVARIRAVLRRVSDAPAKEDMQTGKFSFAGFTLDTSSRAVYDRSGKEVPFTGAEFDLLKVFIDHPQKLISRESLLELTHKSLKTYDTTINVLISRIRGKLKVAGAKDELFRTVRNGGYHITCAVERI